jgi:hypothetical protein
VEIEQARRIEAGDTVIYRRVRRRVIAVQHDGLWAPYFEIEDEGVVSHILVAANAARPVGTTGAASPQ